MLGKPSPNMTGKTVSLGETLKIRSDSPFSELVIVYQTLFAGLVPIFGIGSNIVGLDGGELDNANVISWGSRTSKGYTQHFTEILATARKFSANLDLFSFNLSCMFANLAYEKVKDYNDKTPIFEFFRHVRNAASHNNRFYFKEWKPRRIASWRRIKIDITKKGSNNPFFGVECFGGVLGSADIIFLLIDIEKILPEECFVSK